MFKRIMRHKIITVIALAICAGVGYFGYAKLTEAPVETRYVLETVERGTLVVSVSGSGQVSVSDQVDIKPKASGDILAVNVVVGQEVKTGDVIARLDAGDALKSVRDAEANLETAQLSLERLNQPADELSIMQAENSLTQAQESKSQAEEDLVKAYDDGFNAVANAFLDLPNVISGLHDVLYGTDAGQGGQSNLDYFADMARRYDSIEATEYRDDADDAYQTARASYDENFSDYKQASRYSSNDAVEDLIDETYDTTKELADAIKSAQNLIQFYQDKLAEHDIRPVSQTTTHLSSLSSYTSKANSHISSLLSIRRTIDSDQDALVSADRTIAERTRSLADLNSGADALDLRSQELTIEQRQNSLADAREKLADYTVRAPFDGVIASLDAKKGDAASTGTSLATLITEQRIAEISLNEVDAAEVEVGQKATLTFDAIDDLTITGTVSEVDTIGTVSQGVVSYDVKIVFDAQDERVKPGMSLSASIITEAKTDALMVSNSAIKSSDDVYYVEVLDIAADQLPAGATSRSGVASAVPPSYQEVEIGLSNDTMTEILNGLDEGDTVVTSTVKSSPTTAAASTTTQSNSIFSLPGTGGGGPPSTGAGMMMR